MNVLNYFTRLKKLSSFDFYFIYRIDFNFIEEKFVFQYKRG